MATDEDTKTEPDLPLPVFGTPRAPAGQWASCIRLYDPFEKKTLDLLELPDNEAAFRLLSLLYLLFTADKVYALVYSMTILTKCSYLLVLVKTFNSNLGRELALFMFTA